MSFQGIWTVCDVCAKQIRVEEATLVKDRYNLQNGFLVCQKCLDPTQTLLRPVKAMERPPAQLGKLRKPPSGVYSDNPNSSRVPSAPQRPIAYASTIGETVELRWEGPLDAGSDRIIGYCITRASPQAAYQVIINANTGISEPYYTDVEGLVDEEYTYTVAAINGFGVGAESEIAYYPANRVDPLILSGAYSYLIDGETNFTITTGDGDYIIVGN